jgi:hypothetical protein
MAAIGIIGGLFSFMGAIASANAARQQAQALEYQAQAEIQAAEYKAKQEERVGQEQRAAAQRQALDEKEKEKYVQSHLQATAAASGGGADDPTIVKLSSDIAQRGEYNALSKMWSGESQAVGMENQAKLDRYSGYVRATALADQAAATRTKADATILGGIGGLFGAGAKFG